MENKIKNILLTTGSYTDDWDGRDGLRMKVSKVFEDGTQELIKELSFFDGEPEDNSLGRNFNDVYSISDLLVEVSKIGAEVIKEEVELDRYGDWLEDEEDE